MLIILFRSAILYVLVLLTIRILGKRQVGELKPVDLVLTFLLSEFLSISIQDTQAPLINTLIPVMLLIGLEILVSVLSMKSIRLRTLVQGNPLPVIRNGKLDQKQLKQLRFTVDDLLEALRKKDIFDISEVQYAIVETDGTLSVLLKPESRAPLNSDLQTTPVDNGMPCLNNRDGKGIHTHFKLCDMTDQKLENILKKNKIRAEHILLMTADRGGNYYWIEKAEKK